MTTFKSVNEALDFAIAAEEHARDCYLGLSQTVTKPWMKKVFADFAEEEAGHKEKLLAVKSGKAMLHAEEKVTDLKISNYVTKDVDILPDMDYQQALIVAMQSEKAAFRLYSDLARTVDDENLRDTFLGLAQEEAKHKLRFEIEYDDYVFQED